MITNQKIIPSDDEQSKASGSRLEAGNWDRFSTLEDQTIVTAGTVEKYRNRRLRINAAVTPCSTSAKMMGSDQTLSVPLKGL